ncbi:enoyl-CoA hydratase [Kytococcus aerolatus]|uniref:3-hydroxyisobutyryl-CoA hydrolase n=1 Tax=Kytococcus aerolatus TaxID=592308 RepID=A0A212TFR8_9MICO|nr:enoyl-CoA hydratase/isomerase family protein [Kytococcus aerolatus]SNC64671.1 enoyl-CoA hydratase [Kytococcus aerolatus]
MAGTTEMTPAPQTDEVLFGVRDGVARIHLNRPKALNALTTEMCAAIGEQLTEWAEADEKPRAVVVSGEGKGLCAGGDIKVLRESAVSGDLAGAEEFWATEYAMNQQIADYPIPYVALMHGPVMGGGIGISAHGSHRLVAADAKVAMPETGIGLFPDVGAMHLLARAPRELGTHVALTGDRFNGADAVELGLADVVVPAEALDPEAIVDRLGGGESADALVEALRGEYEQGESALAGQAEWMERCYAGDDAAAIVERLTAEGEAGTEGAAKAAELLGTRSPLSVAATLAGLRAAAGDDLAGVLARDTKMAHGMLQSGDFAEGVRAVLIDRTNDAAWRHASIAEVPAADVEAVLAGEKLG